MEILWPDNVGRQNVLPVQVLIKLPPRFAAVGEFIFAIYKIYTLRRGLGPPSEHESSQL